ncbi:TPR repeat-containing protein [Reticulomyxa filosa]|uniref:TPR repeat-containing protein n=1 Tax=Reticulomyxa filosa TaxID=46433 RepID=X6MUU5_RETFI|nr:TPR repeat-containing protein [Reticulomyxa filosa]|eukprot:ETO17237.1 TPR repeat-containing protein [Reticulomyxa filosa]
MMTISSAYAHCKQAILLFHYSDLVFKFVNIFSCFLISKTEGIEQVNHSTSFLAAKLRVEKQKKLSLILTFKNISSMSGIEANKSAFSPRSIGSKSTSEWDRVLEFLTCISLEQYAGKLKKDGFDRFEALYELKEEDLKELSIPKGHIRILLKNLQKHQIQSETKGSHRQMLSQLSEMTQVQNATHSPNGRSTYVVSPPPPPPHTLQSCSPPPPPLLLSFSAAPSKTSHHSYLPSLPAIPLPRHSSLNKYNNYSNHSNSAYTNAAIVAPRGNLSALSLPVNAPSLMSLPPLQDMKSPEMSVVDEDNVTDNGIDNSTGLIEEEEEEEAIIIKGGKLEEEEEQQQQDNDKIRLQVQVNQMVDKIKTAYTNEMYLNDNEKWDDIHQLIHANCDKWTGHNNAAVAVVVLSILQAIVTSKLCDEHTQCIVYELIAVLHSRRKSATQASHYFKLSLQINPNYVQALHDWGYLVFYELLGKHNGIQLYTSIYVYVLTYTIPNSTYIRFFKKKKNLVCGGKKDLSTRRQSLQKAMELYKQCIKLNSRYSFVYNHYGNVYEDEGLLKEACEWYRKALALRGDMSGYHLDLANTLDDLGDRKAAEKHYLKAIELDSCGEAVYHWNYGIFLEHERRYNEATNSYQVAIQLNPQCVDAYLNLANMIEKKAYETRNNKRENGGYDNEDSIGHLQKNEYLKEALGYYGKVLQLTSSEKTEISVINMYGQALYRCATIYEDMNCLAEAEQCYHICLQRFPQQWQVYVRLANLLYNMGRTVDCNAMFQKGLKRVQNEPENKKLTEEYVKWLKVLNEHEKEKAKNTPRNRSPVSKNRTHTHSIQATRSMSELESNSTGLFVLLYMHRKKVLIRSKASDGGFEKEKEKEKREKLSNRGGKGSLKKKTHFKNANCVDMPSIVFPLENGNVE